MDDTKPCPYCGEPIQKVARKCKWCGEWLDQENHSSSVVYTTCPTCGEQIPADSKICPLCKEPIAESKSIPPVTPKTSVRTVSKMNKLPLYILGGVLVVVILILGGVKFKDYLNDKENQERMENDPYKFISKSLDEAIAQGKTLSAFLRDEKNVDALKSHFGEEQYSLMLALSAYSDEPLTSNDPNDFSAGGYAWRRPSEKGKYGCRLYLTSEALGCNYYYDGLEVDMFGQIVRNPKWKCDYYKDDFNEDDTSKPYIENCISMDNDKGYCWIRMDNLWGITFHFSDVLYFDQILLRNDDTGEVWDLPIDKLSASEAVLRREGQEKFAQWFMLTDKGFKLSTVDSSGQYSPRTASLNKEDTRFYATFMAHVMKKRIDSNIFVSNGIN